MNGLVVRARGGRRHRYQALVSPICPGSDPVALAGHFQDAFGTETLYIADLDAIMAQGDNRPTLDRIADAYPRIRLWIDAGLGSRAALSDFARHCPGRPVIGSETLTDHALPGLFPDAVLSLDYQGPKLLGPEASLLTANPSPRDLILMSLHRVGKDLGPDLDLLSELRRRLPGCAYYVAGGVRDDADIARLKMCGAAGVLLSSALHDGRINPMYRTTPALSH